MHLDMIDLEIIRILQSNARTPVLEISKKLGLSRPTIKSRIDKLREEGVIKKFTIVIDRDAVVKNILLLLRMKIDDNRILESLKDEEEIIEIYETMNEKNIVCKAVVRDIDELREFMDKLNKMGVKEVESSIVLKTLKEEHEADIGPEIGITVECEYCGKEITGTPYKFKIYNKEHYLCCPVCLKSYKKKMSYAKN
jgi:DNA-binding Lrp family transcriptional regulator